MATKSEKSERIKSTTRDYYQAVQDNTMTLIEAANKVVELNISLVTEVLKKYKPWDEDNYQIGCIGLIKASRTYQISREVPFASYACFCIEREIQLAYRQRTTSDDVSYLDESKKLHLDAPSITKDNGEDIENYEVILDENAVAALDNYIQENELTYIVENIIKPAIRDCSPKVTKQTKANIPAWQRAEYLYVMDLVFIDSQKERITLDNIAKAAGLSISNVRTRHLSVMQTLFQRMWFYMNVSFTELLERLRGTHTIPQRLICLDPGKTTGWCLFENGKLTLTGQIPDCFDDKNIDTTELFKLFDALNPDFILYEDYKVYGHKLERHTFNPVFTLRLIGAIESYAQIKGLPTHKQMAVTAKNFCTDDKLKQWGFWQQGARHARDSIRHGCYFLLFYKKGEDIL